MGFFERTIDISTIRKYVDDTIEYLESAKQNFIDGGYQDSSGSPDRGKIDELINNLNGVRTNINSIMTEASQKNKKK